METFSITGEYIALNQLLKAAGLVMSGGEAKEYISSGEVFLNGNVETQKRKKICPGDVINFMGQELKVLKIQE